MIEFIYLDRNSELKKFEVEGTETYLANLSKFNIFIGPNNSGKSRFIRNIFKLGKALPVNAHPTSWIHTHQTAISLMSKFGKVFIEEFSKNGAVFLKEKEFNKIKKSIFDSEHSVDLSSIIQLKLFVASIEAEDYEGNTGNFNDRSKRRKNELSEQLNSLIESYQPIGNKTSFLYIPVLRGLRPIQLNENAFGSDDNYTRRTIYDYFGKSWTISTFNNDKYSVFSGLSLYEEVKKLLLGDEEQRRTIIAFEKFLTENIFQETVTLIPKYQDDVLHIKIGNSPQLEVYNLGDGIQALITLLFPIFVQRDNNALIFVEEPEIHLHPHWQRRFIEALNQFEKHQYFLTTHSNTFVNLPNSSIFRVRTEKNTVVLNK